VGGTGFARTLDPFGNILREEWSNGLWIESDYDEWDRPIERRLPDRSRITYKYEGSFLKKVARVSKDGTEVYSHVYDNHDTRGNPQLETGLFGTTYEYDKSGRRIKQQSPYFQETVDYDPSGNLVRKGNTIYTYDALSQMTSESGRFTAQYDVHYNLKELNGAPLEIEYDLNGHLLRTGLVYDDFDQLIEAGGERYVYDSLGRRLQRGNVSFVYIGDEEIGAFEGKETKELKIPGVASPIAIEIGGKPYFPVADVQGTIRLLVDGKTGKIAKHNDCDAFGVGLTGELPYAYAGKRYDSTSGLLNFGKRYYDPSLHRWLTPDPLGPMDHSNLYQYVFNNPFCYQDPTGEFAFAVPLLIWGAELALPFLSACVAPIVYGAITGAVAYGGYQLMKAFNEQGTPCMGDYYSGGLTPGPAPLNWTMKSGSVDPILPANPDDLLQRPGWKETTHPNAGKKGHRTFENKETGEKLRHDERKSGEPGHKGYDHYHRPNPNSTKGRHDKYLDGQGNPVPDESDPSHVYHPDKVWWNK
jgi:RHS repeat-associated protein